MALANAPSYGGGMRIAPTAVMDDGRLDVVVVGPLARLELVRMFPVMVRGERVGPLPLDCELVPGALRVLAPRTLNGRG